MIAVSQCPSSTSLVASKSMSYNPFPTDALQKIHYATLHQRVHLNQAKSNKVLPDCQSFPSNKYPTEITSALDQYNREKNQSPSLSNISHLHLDKEPKNLLNIATVTKDSTPLDLTCHKHNNSEVDVRAQITIDMDTPKTQLHSNIIPDINTDMDSPKIQAINYVVANEYIGCNSNE